MRLLRAVLFSIGLAGTSRIPVAAGSPQAPPAFRDFTQRVQQYVKLRKALPQQRTTKRQEEIVDRRHALAQEIRESRPDAKQGDIFTPEVSEEFRRVIRSTFQGPNAPNVRKTIRQGEPVEGLHLSVNGAYPENLPLTTVPPTLLLRLPQF